MPFCLARSGLVFVILTSAGCCRDYWHGELEALDSPTQQRLHDVLVGERGRVVVGEQGTLVEDGEVIELDTDAELLAAAEQNGEYGSGWVVVGTGGTLLVSDGQDWRAVPTPTTVDLVAVSSNEFAIAVGDGVVLAYDFAREEVRTIERADGQPWGSLNTIVNAGGGRLMLLGDAGTGWIGPRDMLETSTALELGVDEDLHAGGWHLDDGNLWIVGEGGLALTETGDGWTRVELGTTADFVDFAGGVALTADGQLWDTAADELLVEVPWARGIGETLSDDDAFDVDPPDIVIVGDAGQMSVLGSC